MLETLQKWRRIRGWSLGQLAVKSGVSKASLSRWESGKVVPRPSELTTVLDTLGVPAQERSYFQERLKSPPIIAHESSMPMSGDLLRALRFRRGWTQIQTAQAIGVRQGMLSKWEHSEDWPDLERLHALCFALQANSEEVAALTSGRFLPSFVGKVPDVRTEIELLEEALHTYGVYIEAGNLRSPELYLLRLESDALRLLQREPKAADLASRIFSSKDLHLNNIRADEDHIIASVQQHRSWLRQYAPYKPVVSLTQDLVLLNLRRYQKDINHSPGDFTKMAEKALSLLPIAENHTEYRAWIFMEAASLFAMEPVPDRITIERLIQAALAIPTNDGLYRGNDLSNIRYEAAIHVELKEWGAAENLLLRPLPRNPVQRCHGWLSLVHLYTHAKRFMDAETYLKKAQEEIAPLASQLALNTLWEIKARELDEAKKSGDEKK